MPPSFTTGLEMVLHRLGPGFAIVGQDGERLASACVDWLRSNQDDDRNPRAVTSAIWLLDRLLQLDAAEAFREFQDRGGRRGRGVGLYAFGRRAPEELIRAAESLHEPEPAFLAAWIDSRTSNDDLLTWYDFCRDRGWCPDHVYHESLAIEEYCRRSPDRRKLIEFLPAATMQASRTILEHLLIELGSVEPHLPEPPEDLAAAMMRIGQDDLARACQRLMDAGHHSTVIHLARFFWVQQQSEADLEALLDAEGTFAYRPLERIAKVAPPDRIDVWKRVLEFQERGLVPIVLFSKWLDPARRDLLIPEFMDAGHRHDDDEWAACALQAWMHRAPRDIVTRWSELGRLPFWQKLAFDRHLFAPPACRAPAFMVDVQSVDGDFRLTDPLNFRGV